MPKERLSLAQREHLQCFHLQQEQKNQSLNATESVPGGCLPHWDQAICWHSANPGSRSKRECPFIFCSCDVEDRFVYRNCLKNGTWGQSDYSSCVNIFANHTQCIYTECDPCHEPFKEVVRTTTLVLSLFSVLLLSIALAIYITFKSLHCRRLTIHVNLALAFILRFSVLTAWILLHKNNTFHHCSGLNKEPNYDLDWICKTILWLTLYFQAASVFWMFVEGGFLISRFTVFAMRQTEGPILAYYAVGWGFPLMTLLVWSGLHETHSAKRSFCWMPYTQSEFIWVLVVPIGIALVLNFMFLSAIIAILVQKLRAENTAESKKIWKAIKATLLLVPLLGVANILLFYEPEQEEVSVAGRNAYMLISAILQHSQGVSVAVLYCFANGEVQNAVRRRVIHTACWQHLVPSSKWSHSTSATAVQSARTAREAALNQVELISTPPSGRRLGNNIRFIDEERFSPEERIPLRSPIVHSSNQ